MSRWPRLTTKAFASAAQPDCFQRIVMSTPTEPIKSTPREKKTLSKIIIGPARDIRDPRIFHSLSLVAFLAWVGLGSDGLSSSCYGPEEAFLALTSSILKARNDSSSEDDD